MKKPIAMLKKWELNYDRTSASYYITGSVYDDKLNRFPDGQRINTSRITEINFKENYVKTKNNIYKIGDYFI